MFQRLFALLIILLLPLYAYAHDHDSPGPAPTEPAFGLRHEKWVFAYAVSSRTPAPPIAEDLAASMDTTRITKDLKPTRGLELFFYADGTFKIRDWFYGESSGMMQSFYSGTYSETAEPARLELVFETEQRPIAPYFMHVLRDSRIDELANPLARCQIKVLEELDKNWLKAKIVCYDDESLTYIFGQAFFMREKLDTVTDE